MTSEIQIFNNPQFGEIRVTTNEQGEPMFCMSDVAKALGYANPAKAVIDHCKGVTVLETPTQNQYGATVIQQIKFGKEGEVYRLVMKSKLPEAEKFQDWVCDEVLPSIRKHGAYMSEQVIERTLSDPDYLIQLATTLKEEKQKRLEAEKKIKEDASKVLFADAVVGSTSTCLIGELAKIISQNGYPIGQNRLFKWLRNNGYLGTRGENYNIPNQPYVEQGLFEIKKGVRSAHDGVMKTTITTKVTQRGCVYFINKFLGKSAAML